MNMEEEQPMKKQEHTPSRNKIAKLAMVLYTLIGLYVLSFFIYPTSYWDLLLNMSVPELLFDLFTTLIICVVIVEFNFLIDKRLDKWIPWTKHALNRLFFQTIIQIAGTFIVVLIVASIFAIYLSLIDKLSNTAGLTLTQAWQYVIAILILTLIINIANSVYYLAANWKSELLNATAYKVKAAESKQLAAETELQSLRLQLDPHFVFNNLTVLSELILKDPQLGFAYTENFAKVYRYLLVNAKKDSITLREELKFLDLYLLLLQSRIGNGAIFDIDVDEALLNRHLPPVTLQLLVENALKYNSIDEDRPLHIRIYSNDMEELVVYNELLPLLNKHHSSGIGLKNIVSRYSLLTDRKPRISQDDVSFTVSIPLFA
ncbi:sensor histidine kinase [Sphingobacterium bambusae]|nr:histidine kinase [Sphingobacterium bambusae]WPL48600.1 histidine kinase [Sphingobacterium bambusae]